ncbi:MAG: hypothetical protein AAB645_01915 [Patescibacteria group bacterium]
MTDISVIPMKIGIQHKMDDLSKIFKHIENLHHAYLLIGERAEMVIPLKEFLSKRFGADFVSPSNPDLFIKHYDSFGIDEGRTLKDYQTRRALNGHGKFFILSLDTITTEAQNSLLKTLEDPFPDNHFFIIARSAKMFLPTVLSRCQLLEIKSHNRFSADLIKDCQKFLKTEVSDRLNYIKKILKEQEENKQVAPEFVNCLLDQFRQKINLATGTAEEIKALEQLEKNVPLVGQRGGSPRLVLEHLALVLPVVS